MNNFFAASLDRHKFMFKDYNPMYDSEDLKVQNLLPYFCDDLELDLRCSKEISDKCKSSKDYSYKLYSSLCNNKFKKKDKVCDYSFRVVSGIIANLNQSGDYIDWYCSGFEGTIDNEVLKDLMNLGWELYAE